MQKGVSIIVFACFFVLLLMGCVKQSPQLPANKNNNIDSSLLALQLANEKLIEHEDSLLNEFVSAIDSTFIKHESGFWYKINSKSSDEHKYTKFKVVYSLYSLENELLLSKSEDIVVGKNQIIPALDELLKQMRSGESATVIAPWYLAYGMHGNELVKPYASLKIYLNIRAIS